jgi:sialidase-1
VSVDVFTSGTEGYHTFRIPAIVRTPAGTLHAFAEGRRDGAGDAGDIDLVLRRSCDGGRTWGRLQVVSRQGTDTVGNPAPVVDPATGDLVLLSTRNSGTATESQLLRGQVPEADSRRVLVQRSLDDGTTWTRPLDITDSAKRPEWRWYATGPCHGIALHCGRLVVPANHSVAREEITPSVYGGHLLLSDDGGQTWRIGAVDDASEGVNANETTVAELPDGRLYLNTRNQHGSAPGSRAHTTSSDSGESFDQPYQPVPSIAGPVVQGSLVRLGSTLLLALPSDPSERRAMAVRSSRDGGQSWQVAAKVSDAPAAYSDLVVLATGRVGLLFETGENGPYERIEFVELEVDQA